ncbi:hypothetical protein ABAC460_10165 [Asticcacaulis sp. AC460]|uniref:phage tail tape measure protein n=1 Tax=Asticcacaulis sp. AC460 TaxID=1282360 RepID=UPI0003C3C7C4|nr:phage tail tape measure protein [Asticcacaulis sp. AC460]ESQ90119.1 hypothetical protein ABAC460_10165 [Asticcacaulis sp. AC460]
MSTRSLNLRVLFQSGGNLNNALRGLTGAGGQAQNTLRRFNNELRTQRTELRDLQAQIRSGSGNLTDLLNRERALEEQIRRTTGQLDRQRAAMARQNRADMAGSNMRASGQQNMMVGAGVGAGLFILAKQASDFGDGMTDIRLKADMSAEATAQMQRNIEAAAKAAHQLPENMRQGVDNLIGAGMDTKSAMAMTTPIGKAATAYRAEIADLSATSFANFSNLKVPVQDTTRAFDAMAQAGKMGNFELRDMATYFPSLTAQSQAFGQTGVSAVADLSAALQIARKGAGDASKAATNVENLLAKINTEETQKKFAKFGIDLPNALKKAYAQGKTPLEAIAELSQQATGGDLSKLSFLFQDMQAQGALRPLIQNIDEYRKIRAAAMNASGTLDADFAIRSQDASVQARALKGNLMTLAVNIGSALLPSLNNLAQSAIKVTDKFAAWAQKNPQLLAMIVKGIALFAAFSVGVGAIRFALGTVIGPMVQLYNAFIWLKNLGPVATMLARAGPMMATAFGIMRTAALFLARGLMQAGMMMLANPMILAIVAVVAVIGVAAYLIYKNWDKIKVYLAQGWAYLQQVWANVKAAFAAAGQWMGQAWSNITAAIGAGVKMAFSLFMKFTPMGWLLQLVPGMLKVGGQLMDGLISGIRSKLDAIKTMITGVAGKVIGWFKGVLGIKSPSRVFMGFGGHISNGLAIGMQKTMSRPMKQARTLAAGVAGAFAVGTATPGLAGMPAGTGPVIVQLAPGSIVVNAAPGQSAYDIAAQVEAILTQKAEAKAAAERSKYRDND